MTARSIAVLAAFASIDLAFAVAVLVIFVGALIVTLLTGAPSPSDLDRGRCIGWAESQGLVPAWDEDGACVLGMYPADEPALAPHPESN